MLIIAQSGPPYGGVTNSANQTIEFLKKNIPEVEVADLTKDTFIKSIYRFFLLVRKHEVVFFQIGNIRRSLGMREKAMLFFSWFLKKEIIVRFFAGNNYSIYHEKDNQILKFIDLLFVETLADLEFFASLNVIANVYQLRNSRPSFPQTRDLGNSNVRVGGYYAGALNSWKGLELFRVLDLNGNTIDLYGRKPCDWEDTLSVKYSGEFSSEYSIYIARKYQFSLLITSWPTEGHSGFVLESIIGGCIPIVTRYTGAVEVLGPAYPFYIEENTKKAVEQTIEKFENFSEPELRGLKDLLNAVKFKHDFDRCHNELLDVIKKR